jgi:hypothetical protein
MRNPWDDCPSIWKNEKAFMQWLRSQTRRIWSRSPIKLEYKKARRYKAPVGRNNKEIFVSTCEICNKESNKTEVDHILPGGSFNDWKTYTEWAKRILWVTFEDIRELCKECHEAVTLAHKKCISLDQARIEKKLIVIMKSTPSQKEFLLAHGTTPGKNRDERLHQIQKLLNSGAE